MPAIGMMESAAVTEVRIRRRRRACGAPARSRSPGCASSCRSRSRARRRLRPRPRGAASTASITSAPQISAYSRATPTHDTSMPSGAINRSAGPFTGAPPTIGLIAIDPVAPGDERVAHAGDGQDRPDRDHRVRRADHDRVGLAQRLEHARARAGRCPRRRTAPTRPATRPVRRRTTPASRARRCGRRARSTVMRVRTRSSVIGSSRTSRPHARVISAVTSRERGARRAGVAVR